MCPKNAALQRGPASIACKPWPLHRSPDRAAPQDASLPDDPEELFALSRCARHRAPDYRIRRSSRSPKRRRCAAAIPGGHCKSLFLKDKKGGFWLGSRSRRRRIDLKKLAARHRRRRPLLVRRRRRLYRLLGSARGGHALRPRQRSCGHASRSVLDAACWNTTRSIIIRWKTTATTAISPADLLRLIAASGHVPRIVDLPRPRARAGIAGSS